MEYILNKSPLKTTNSFKINDIKLDLDLPQEYTFHDFKYNNTNNIKIETKIFNEFNSKIGLTFKKAYGINIIVPKNTIIKEKVELIYEFKNDEVLIDNINIIYEENSEASITIKYISLDNGNNFHHLKETLTAKTNSKANITIVNLMNENSKNFIAIENLVLLNSKVSHNIIDIGGSIKVYNVVSDTFDNAENYINNIYIGKNNDLIDLNYHVKNIGEKSINNIEVQGVLDDNAKKNFKGTIDFIEKCKNSIGKEKENCILLSNTCVSRSLPMLLCHEANVEGAHSVATGKLDNEKLFYIMSRGLTKKESEKLLILSNFTQIINELPDNLKEEIIHELDMIIK